MKGRTRSESHLRAPTDVGPARPLLAGTSYASSVHTGGWAPQPARGSYQMPSLLSSRTRRKGPACLRWSSRSRRSGRERRRPSGCPTVMSLRSSGAGAVGWLKRIREITLLALDSTGAYHTVRFAQDFTSRYPTGFRRRSVAHARCHRPRQQLPRLPSLSDPEVILCSDFARSPRVLSRWQRLSARVRERRCHPRRQEHRHLNRRLHPRVWLRHSQGFPQLGRFRSDPQAQARRH